MTQPTTRGWAVIRRTVAKTESIDARTIRRTRADALSAYIGLAGTASTSTDLAEGRIYLRRVTVQVTL